MVIIAGTAVAAAIASAMRPDLIAVKGVCEMSLPPKYVDVDINGTCSGKVGSGAGAAKEGAIVSVSDNEGKKLSFGKLERGYVTIKTNEKIECEFPFRAGRAPSGKGPYTVTINNFDGAIFDEDELGNVKLKFGFIN
jgi:hypothetical protein